MSAFETCDFSEALEQSSGLVQFSPKIPLSPESSYVASACGSRLLVRNANSLETIHIYVCIDKIERLEWSPDGQYVLCVMLLRGSVQIFSVADSSWRCRLNEGVAGLISARWAPDSRHVILESDFGIQLSIWSLLNGSSQLIMHPKTPSSTGAASTASLIAFSNCSK